MRLFRKILSGSSRKVKIISLLSALMVFAATDLRGQVISNSGANVSVTIGTYVITNDLENTLGNIINNGTLDLTNKLDNSAILGGNGLYFLKGDWIDHGTFNPGTSHVTFKGTAGDQVIDHDGSGESFYNLTLNNPANVYQISNPLGSLTILNDLNIAAGSLRLHQSTSFLNVNRSASITGSLIYNGLTVQTASIGGDLTGSGTIDMRAGDREHILNLAGAINQIGFFLTSIGESIVNYNGSGPTQTVFAAPNYRNLVISNSGIKTLQGNSNVTSKLTISGGTFDLGTATTTLNVTGNTSITGTLLYNGTSAKTVNLSGNLSGSGLVDMSGGNLAHSLFLDGVVNSIGTYSSGNSSTVTYRRNGIQNVFASNDYNNLSITGTNTKSLIGDVRAKSVLTMAGGDIDAGTYLLEVSNPAFAAINRTTGKVIGRLRRTVGLTGGEYLYPVGSVQYNPFKITFNQLNPGSLTVRFRQEDIGTAGLPLDDDGNEIFDRYTTGYWSLNASSASLSNNYSIKVDFEGFPVVDASASIIKRTNGGNLELDGSHDALTADEISRKDLLNGISNGTTDFAIGKGRPRITDQPDNIDICETFNAFFDVDARGRGTLTFKWEVDKSDGMGFTLVSNGGVYTGATTDRLVITAAPYAMNGYLYRCIITDNQGHPNTSSIALLTVNKIPVATATTPAPECPGVAFDNIMLGTSNGVTGTTFAWSRSDPAGIETNLPLSGSAAGDMISGIFNNTTDSPISVVFTIVPTGPGTTFCEGTPISRTVTVNPVPKILQPANTTQCDSTITDILLSSPSVFTSGVITFRYTTTSTGDVTGFTSPVTGLPDDHHITDKLINHTNTYHTVTYRVVPVSPLGCADGIPVNAKVTVNPTPKAEPLNNLPEVCINGPTGIILTTPTNMTTGSVVFDYTVSSSGGGVVTGDMSPGNDASPGYTISRTYQNSSHDLQSVFFTIIPVNNSICNAGPAVLREVKVHAKPIWNITQIKPLTCESGAGLGAVRADLSTGAAPYHIIWNGPDGYYNEDEVEIDNLKDGAYYASVTDNLGCQANGATLLVKQYADPYLYPYFIGAYHVTCIGSTDGRIEVGVASGITPPYNYNFIKNETEVLGSGVFVNTIDRRIFNNLEAGSYTLVITDVYGCVRTKTYTLRPPLPMEVAFGKSTYSGGFNVSCRGYNDGSAWVESVTGGRGGYTYRWYTTDGSIPGPINTSRIDNLTPGTYFLEVSDALNCKAVFSVQITQPEGMELQSFVLSSSRDGAYNVSCNGGSDGSIDMTIQGGSGSYNYSWSGPDGFTAAQEDITGLRAGSYNCTVTDMNGCVLTPVPVFTLTQPPALIVTTSTSVSADGDYQINCYGGEGSIYASASGGSLNTYTYNWTTANGSGIIDGMQNQTSLIAGTYHLEVKDYNKCIAATDVTIAQPPDLVLDLKPKHITCEIPGFSNGAINLSVSGGAGTMSYSWSNGSVTEDVSGLTPGMYSVAVTYNNSCTKSDTVNIYLPPTLTYSASFSNYNSYEVSCFGMSDGEIHITPTSGKGPYVYSWTGPGGFNSTSPDLSGLKAGIYNFQLTDSNLCTAGESIELRQPGELQARFTLSQSLTGGFNLNCAGDSTGTIVVNPHNSVSNVSLIWSDGFTGRTRTNLKAGTYTVVITDDNNCQAVGTATLTQPDSIRLKYEIKQPFCPDMPDGEISLTVTGGVPGADYSYHWSNDSGNSTLSEIPMGEYKVIVEDLNRCVVKDSLMLMPQKEACLIIPNIMSPNGDLVNDYWNIENKELYPEMEIRIFNRWGETVWRSKKGYPDPWDGKSKGIVLPIDSYHYIIDLHNGTKPVIGNITIVK